MTLQPACTGLQRELRRRCARTLVALLVGVSPLVPAPAPAQDGAETSEPAVKAAYLYRICSYVTWPSQRALTGPLVIGILHSPQVHAELAQLLPGRKIDGREIELRRLQDTDALDAVHVVFVGKEPPVRSSTWSRLVANRGLLLVSDQSDGLAQGAAINFLRVGGRLRFEAAPDAADRLGLKLSARLLAVAERVVLAP